MVQLAMPTNYLRLMRLCNVPLKQVFIHLHKCNQSKAIQYTTTHTNGAIVLSGPLELSINGHDKI